MSNKKITAEQKKQVEDVKKKLAEINKPQVITKIEMRPQECDIRELSQADKDQLTFRYMKDLVAYSKMILETMTDLLISNVVVLEQACKQNGNKVDGFVECEKRLVEYQQNLIDKMKEEKKN